MTIVWIAAFRLTVLLGHSQPVKYFWSAWFEMRFLVGFCTFVARISTTKLILVFQPLSISITEDDDESGAFQYRSPDVESNCGATMKEPVQSYTSLASTNTSPVSTLTGSSDVDMCRVLQDSGIYTTGTNSIGSIMSMSEKSTSSLSPIVRRHSLTGNLNIRMN